MDGAPTDVAARAGAEPALISVVVPCYNEAAGLEEFHARVASVMDGLGGSWCVVYVNDGSRDRTLQVLEGIAARDPHAGVLNLSRNFGKEAAMTAGLDHAPGEAVVVIDADLQDPPELIPDLVAAWRGGADIAYAQRRARAGETWAKKQTASVFYRLMAKISRVSMPVDSGDFRIMSRRAVDSLLRLREHHRFMKGLFAWIGYPQVAVPYDRHPRHAGRTSFNYWKLWNLALEGLTSFSIMPLKIASYFGLGLAFLSGHYGIWIIFKTLVIGADLPGYPSLMVVILFLGGVQLITLGILGEYLGRVFNEVKQRPLYLVERFLPARAVAEAARRGQ